MQTHWPFAALRQHFSRAPWKEAALWLCALGPFFFLTYGLTNSFTATRSDVGVMVFSWERHIPFLPWTIVPYWSIDFFYGLSLFLPTQRQELRMQVARLALSTVLCVAGFLLFPLRMSFPHPPTSGVLGFLFTSLGAFDLPYNQAPSLHICLLVVLWDMYRNHVPRRWLPLVHGWSALIALSVLTTYQHHSIDVATGFLAGVLCCYLIPRPGWPQWPPLPWGLWKAGGQWKPWQSALPHKAARLARRYGLGALACAVLAAVVQGWGWLWLYPALSMACVALAYAGAGPAAMQKNSTTGAHSLGALWVLAPYRWVAACTRHYYLARLPGPVEIMPGLWLGGYPGALPAPHCAVLDLCAEYPRARCTQTSPAYACVPLLDLLPPTATEMQQALDQLAAMHLKQPVLVHCALGLTRSAAVCACYIALVQHISVEAALAQLEHKRKGVVLSPMARTHLAEAFASIAKEH